MKVVIFSLFLFLIAIGVNGFKIESTNKSTNYLSSSGIDSFDVSEKWSQCKEVFEDIQVQGNCSSSWAISVATSIRDRRCIKFGIKVSISAYDLISCCSDCLIDGKNGCNDGDHSSAFHYFSTQGLVSGGAYRSDEGCKPYLIRPNPRINAPNSTICEPKCKSSYKDNSYENDKIKGEGKLVFSYNNQGVMDEIMKNGPLVSEFELYEDFLNYSGGIYQHKEGKSIGYYYAKILGWGTDDVNGLEYWKAAASFGKNWGESGMFRIRKGNDECGFESSIIGSLVGTIKTVEDGPDFKLIKSTEASKPVDMSCQKIIAYYNGTFEWPNRRSNTFHAQFQIIAEINLQNKRLQLEFDNFNMEFAEGYEFGVENGKYKINCDVKQHNPCLIPFENDLSYFHSWFYPYGDFGYKPDLILINPLLEKKFTLLNAIGNCATTIQNNNLTDVDSDLFKSCFCCGDNYDPHTSLGCPASPWS